MENEVIERVGAAILEALEALGDSDISAGLGAVEGIRGVDIRSVLGRVAIETMREPTDAMEDAGCMDDGRGGDIDALFAATIYRAMIDAALRERLASRPRTAAPPARRS